LGRGGAMSGMWEEVPLPSLPGEAAVTTKL